jgi:hypothetical protein
MAERVITTTDHRPHPVNRGALAAALTGRLRGDVRFDSGSRALYATDASNYRQLPLGVVIPRDIDDVVAAVEICRRFEAPILGRGGGTSLAGQGCNDGVVLDFSRYVNHLPNSWPRESNAACDDGARPRRSRGAPRLSTDRLRGCSDRDSLSLDNSCCSSPRVCHRGRRVGAARMSCRMGVPIKCSAQYGRVRSRADVILQNLPWRTVACQVGAWAPLVS